MKSFQFLSFLILINLFNLYICPEVTLTAIKIGNDLDLNCEVKYEDKDETLQKLEVFKDDKSIFAFNKTEKKHNITGVPGATDIVDISQDYTHFKIAKTNSNTTGKYKCKVTTNKAKDNTKESKTVDLSKFEFNKTTDSKASLTIMFMEKEFMFNCSTTVKFNTNRKLAKLIILKGNDRVISLTKDDKVVPNNLVKEKHSVGDPSLSFHLNKTDKTYGKYSCQIFFTNDTDLYDTLIQSNEIEFKENSANSYLSDKLMLFLSTFLLIFVSFK